MSGLHYAMSLTGLERDAVVRCVRQGIDSRLAAFVDSTFTPAERGPRVTLKNGRTAVVAHSLDCAVAYHELPVLLRRLAELTEQEYDAALHEYSPLGEAAEMLARDLIRSLFYAGSVAEPVPGDPDEMTATAWVEDYRNTLTDEAGGFYQRLDRAWVAVPIGDGCSDDEDGPILRRDQLGSLRHLGDESR